MGKYNYFELNGWQNGKPLSASEKEEIQDIIFDLGTEDLGSGIPDDDPQIMCFSSESFSAYDDVTEALSDYAQIHENTLLDLLYECEEENDHHRIRFLGSKKEEYDQISVFPPFTRLTHPGEYDELPVLVFHFVAMEDMPEARILVLTERWLKEQEIGSLEDSISSYMENAAVVDYEQAVRDVMNATDIGYWLLTPQTTFYI